jgi:very-short-patch-repair endonuclease
VRPAPTGVRLIEDVLSRREVNVIDGGLVTSRPRTIVDCLRVLPERAGLDLLERALQKRWIHPDELTGYVRRLAGRRGAPRLARHIGTVSAGTRSAAERRLLALLNKAGIRSWRANVEIYDGQGLIGVVDLAFEEAKVFIEVDGWAFHSTPDRFQHDRARQNRLVAAGWVPLRFTWRDLTERPGYVIRTIREVVG